MTSAAGAADKRRPFRQSIRIDDDALTPLDNWMHLAPGEESDRAFLEKAGRPRGRIAALGATPSPTTAVRYQREKTVHIFGPVDVPDDGGFDGVDPARAQPRPRRSHDAVRSPLHVAKIPESAARPT